MIARSCFVRNEFVTDSEEVWILVSNAVKGVFIKDVKNVNIKERMDLEDVLCISGVPSFV